MAPFSNSRYDAFGFLVVTLRGILQMTYDHDGLETTPHGVEDPLVAAEHYIDAGERCISCQAAITAQLARKGYDTGRAEAVLQTMQHTLTLMYTYREFISQSRRLWHSVLPHRARCVQPIELLQQPCSDEIFHLTFQSTQVNTGCADAEGQLVFADKRLIAVLVRLDDEVHSDDMRDSWFLEVGFGPCATSDGQVFQAMAEAIAWIRQRLLGVSDA